MEMNKIQMINYIRRIYRQKYTKEEIEELVNKNGIEYFQLGIHSIGTKENSNEELFEVN